MSMVSYAAGSRYLSLIGGVCLSFYDWYCDLPPSSPQVWGEQTDVPESADWYNSSFIIAWGSNVPQTRTPDAHFLTEARYKGTKTVSITPDYSEVAKLGDLWLKPKQGTDAALAMAMGHVILKEFHLGANKSEYFENYCRQYSDMPLLVRLVPSATTCWCRTAICGLRISPTNSVRATTPSGRPSPSTGSPIGVVLPTGSIGFRWGEQGKWNIEEKEAVGAGATKLRLSLIDAKDGVAAVAFPYFGGIEHEHFSNNPQADVLVRNVPVKKLRLAEGDTYVATVFDLLVANYGVDRGLGGEHVAASYEQDVPYTPAWQERITGVKANDVIAVARQFADNANKTHGKSMVIIGAGMNHWYHSDMNYRGIINMLMMCGCIGQSGGGWAHYVGQEKLRPQTGWTAVAFALDWLRPPRQMNSTSFFYAHTDQWRYEKLQVSEILSPLADPKEFSGSLIDFNVRAERMGWLPSAPQLETNPIEVVKKAEAAGLDAKDYAVKALKDGTLKLSCEDPDNPANFPRNLFIWRSNLLGSSGKGHEYFLKHLLGTRHGVQGKDLGELAAPSRKRWCGAKRRPKASWICW